MTDYKEEQTNELSALESIFADDFKLTGEDPYSFTIQLVPCPGGDEEENHIAVSVDVSFPEKYPDEVCMVQVNNEKSLAESQVLHLQTMAEETAEANVGMAMVFAITSAIQEWMQDNNKPELTAHEQIMAKIQEEEEEEAEQKNLEDEREAERKRKEDEESPLKIPKGILVTTESFAEWKKKFDESQALKVAQTMSAAEKKAQQQNSKYTGKQLFLQNLVKNLGLDEEGKEGEEEKVFWYNDGLYADEDIDDLDDEDDEDDESEPASSPTNAAASPSSSTPLVSASSPVPQSSPASSPSSSASPSSAAVSSSATAPSQPAKSTVTASMGTLSISTTKPAASNPAPAKSAAKNKAAPKAAPKAQAKRR